MIPLFSSSSQALFYNLLVYLRVKVPNNDQNPKQLEEIRKFIELYLENTSEKNEKGELVVKYHINSVIEIMYQTQRHEIKINKDLLPKICLYRFTDRDHLKP